MCRVIVAEQNFIVIQDGANWEIWRSKWAIRKLISFQYKHFLPKEI